MSSIRWLPLVGVWAAASGCTRVQEVASEHVPLPFEPWHVAGPILRTEYDGITNDLLTGGLGKSGLRGRPPSFVDPIHPTKEELRTAAIYHNYRALVDMTSGGGYGVIFGPNIDAHGKPTRGEGMVAGVGQD